MRGIGRSSHPFAARRDIEIFATEQGGATEVTIKRYAPTRDLRVYFLSAQPPTKFGPGG
jgi:hypothetical protein